MDFKEQVLDVIRNQQPGASIPGTMRQLDDEGVEGARGDFAMDVGQNVVLWVGMSLQLISALNDLLREKLIHLHTNKTELGLWVFAGADGWLDMPLAKNPPRNGYRDTHWVPVFIFLGGSRCSNSDPECLGI